MEDRKNTYDLNNTTMQNLILENREDLTVTGVIDVLSFDDQIVIIQTQLGLLTIKGDDLKINKLSIDNLEVKIQGKIISLGYNDEQENHNESSGFLSKIFK